MYNTSGMHIDNIGKDMNKKAQSIILFTLSVPEKRKNLIFEIPIVPQTLNISNLRTISAGSTWMLLESLLNTL